MGGIPRTQGWDGIVGAASHHVLAKDDDEGEDLEEDGGWDGRQPRLLPHQVRVHLRLRPVVEGQLHKGHAIYG